MKWPALLLSIFMLLLVLVITLGSNVTAAEIFLLPSIVAFLFFLVLFALIVNFKEVPRKIEPGDRFFLRIKIRFYRLWFTILGVLFFLAAGASLLLAVRLLRVWFEA